jgi:hypothetical protein
MSCTSSHQARTSAEWRRRYGDAVKVPSARQPRHTFWNFAHWSVFQQTSCDSAHWSVSNWTGLVTQFGKVYVSSPHLVQLFVW